MNKKYQDKHLPLYLSDGWKTRSGTVYESASFTSGWDVCKEEVLKILQQEWTGLDMSVNSCDQYYIDKIKEL